MKFRRYLLAGLPVYLMILAFSCSCGGGGKPRVADSKQEPALGSVKITSAPTGAAVFLDGHQRLGKTPLVIERPGGTRLEILLVKDGFLPHSMSAAIAEGRQLQLYQVLKRDHGTLVVSAGGIHGAHILVDGVSVGVTPSRLEIETGADHLVEVKKEGFNPYKEKVKTKAGETVEVEADLVPLGKKARPMGWLLVKTNHPSLISLDQKVLGTTPLRKIRMLAKTYQLQVKPGTGSAVVTQQITVKPNELTTVILQLK